MRERPRSRAAVLGALVVALFAAATIGRLTAPTADPVPTTRPGAADAAAPRATRTASGVPVGYPRTRVGAVAAMAAYGQALADPRIQLDDRRRRAVAATVGTDRYARSLEDAAAVFAARRSGAVGQALGPGARAVFLAVPVAFRVVSYNENEAVIRSWGVAIVASDTGLQPRASWGMTTTTALWQHDDWKVERVVSRPGPVPAGTGQPSPAAAFMDALAGMRTLRHAP
jgi:hypothetical protein